MRTKHLFIPIILIILALSSCKQDAYFLFNDVARIQFGPDIARIYTASYNMADTTRTSRFIIIPPRVPRIQPFSISTPSEVQPHPTGPIV